MGMDNQSLQIVEAGLLGIEEQMRRVFENMEFARETMKEAEENLDLQKINAEVFAWPSLEADPRKMLADEKKIKVQQIVRTDKEVKRFGTILKDAKTKLASAIAEHEAVKAKYGAYRALADLYAAQLKAEVR
jgi:hypothetical protein